MPHLETVTSSTVTAWSLRESLGVSSSLTTAWVVVLLSKPPLCSSNRPAANSFRSSPFISTTPVAVHGCRRRRTQLIDGHGGGHWQIWSAFPAPYGTKTWLLFVVIFDQPWRSGERRGVFYMSAVVVVADGRVVCFWVVGVHDHVPHQSGDLPSFRYNR